VPVTKEKAVTDPDLDLLQPIALASLRLSIVALSAHLHTGSLTPGQRQEAAAALHALREDLLPIVRNADTAQQVLGNLSDLAQRLSDEGAPVR
jgi:CBS-domain-containing membrane protein